MPRKIRLRSRQVGEQALFQVPGAPVLVAYGTIAIEAAMPFAARPGNGDGPSIVVGIIRDSRHRRWCLGVAYGGGALTWLSSYQRCKQAEDQIERVVQAAQQGCLADAEGLAALVRELAEDGDGQP